MQHRIYFLFLISMLLFSSCSFLTNDLEIAEKLIESNPDSALVVLKNSYSTQSFSNSDRALYGLLLFEALDKTYNTLEPDSVINFSVEYFKKTNNDNRLASSYFYKARMYKYALSYENATKYYLKALDIIKNSKSYDLLGKVYSDLGEICSVQKEYNNAREKLKQAIYCFKKINKTADVFYRTIDLGNTYRNEQKFEMAHKYYLTALQQTKDSVLLGVIYQEIGVTLIYTKEFKKAEDNLRRSIKYPYIGNDFAIRLYTLAELFYLNNKLDSAMTYATKALKFQASYYTKKECIRILANSSYLKGDYKLMAEYMTVFQNYSDSVHMIETQTKTDVIEDIYQSSAAESKSKKWLLIFGSILPILIIIALFVYYKLRNRNKGNEKQIEQQVEQLTQYEEELSSKQTVLIKSLKQQIADAKLLQMPLYKKASLAQREKIDKDIYNTCLHTNDFDSFSALMNQTFNDLVKKLCKQYKDISHKEIIWCCLTLLDVPTPEIQLVLDLQLNSLYKLKQRLAQKVNLKSSRDLVQFLLNNIASTKD